MKKIVATLLLDRNDNYVLEDGSLPRRPQWDKALLETFVIGESLSEDGYNMVGKKLKENVFVTHGEPYPITIPEINALADIILVTRSYTSGKGKRFRFNNFEKVLSTGQLEIWRRT